MSDFPQPGDSAAIITARYSTRSVKRVTITRLTKTRAVVDDGSWFPLSTLERREGTAWSTTSYRLMPADAPKVAVIEREERHQRLVDDVRGSFERFQKSRSRGDAERLRDAVERLLADGDWPAS